MPEYRLAPFVYWSQDQDRIRLRVALTNVKDPEVLIGERRIVFEAVGEGAGGKHVYGFDLDLHSSVSDKASSYVVTDRSVDFVLEKKNKKVNNGEAWWPRLTDGSTKLPWLKIDFDRWRDGPGEEGGDEDMMQQFDMSRYAGLSEQEAARRMADDIVGQMGSRRSEVVNLRLIYMFMYNLLLFVGFLAIFCEMIYKYSFYGPDYFAECYGDIAPKWHCCQLAQWLELFHALIGYTGGSWKGSVLLHGGRSFVLFLLASEPELQTKPFVFYLFCVWALIELARYPYYGLAVVEKSFEPLTWLRYTLWIPLLPLGILIEGVMILRSIPLFEQSGAFSVPGIFYFPYFLLAYIVVAMMPGGGFLMYSMYNQRKAKYSRRPPRRKPKKA